MFSGIIVGNEQNISFCENQALATYPVSGRERTEQALEACHQAQRNSRAALAHFDAVYVVFSRRERELLRRIAESAASAKQVAAALEISPSTASAHLRKLCDKAGVENEAQLVVYVMQQPVALRSRTSCRRGIHL